MKRAYISIGCDQQGRMTPTLQLQHEDASGICDTVPSELLPGEACSELLADPVPMEPPGPSLGAVLLLMAGVGFSAILALHLALRAWPQ